MPHRLDRREQHIVSRGNMAIVSNTVMCASLAV